MGDLSAALGDGGFHICQHGLIVLEVLAGVGDHAQNIIVGGLQIVRQAAAHALKLLGDGLGSYLVELFLDLILNGGGACVCNLGRYRVPLLVYIIFDLRTSEGSVFYLQQICTEGLRYYDGGVVFS